MAMFSSLDEIREHAARFASERDWEKFQSPKNLVMALSVEVAELVEQFQWLDAQESHNLDTETKAAVADEVADVLLYLVRLADELDIDIYQAASDKVIKNEAKYPVAQVKGSAKKYTHYEK